MASARELLAALALLTLAFPQSALAQEPSDPQAAAGEEAAAPSEEAAPAPFGGIEEIVVTATKRAASVQDVPIAVTAISSEGLAARGISDVKDLQQVAPSLSITDSNSTTNGGTIRIRGMGTSGNNPGLESAVGSFIDGVYRSRAGLALQDLIDVERVEILRGPQGTLFGKNTSAGLVHVITKQPEFAWGGHVGASVGSYDLRKLQGSITGPLIEEKLAFRFAGQLHVRDGYYDDIDTGDSFADRDRWALKGQLLWTPTDDFDVRLIADYTKMREHCCPATYSVVGLNANHVVALGGDAYGTLGDDNLDVGTNYDPREDVDDWGLSVESNLALDSMSVKGILAYRNTDVFRAQDPDFTNADIIRPNDTDEQWENWSLELQLQGQLESLKLDWMVGAYGYLEDLDNTNAVQFATQGPAYIGRLVAQSTGSPGLGTILSNQVNVDEGRATAFAQENDGWSIFTHDIFHVTERLDLTLGARYSWERKQGSTLHAGTPVDAIFSAPFCDRLTGFTGPGSGLRNAVGFSLRGTLSNLCDNISWSRSYTNDDWTGTLQLGYALTDAVNLYGSVARGTKSGGYNLDPDSYNCTPTTTPDPNNVVSGNILCLPDDQTQFEPEFSYNYELGVKSSWLDGRLVANGAFFTTIFKGFQLNQFTGLGFIIRNVSRVKAQGAELELTAFPFDGVIGSFAVTYADTRYGDDVDVCFRLNRPDLSVNRCPGDVNPNNGSPDDAPLLSPQVPYEFPTNQWADGHRITQSPAWSGSLSLSIQKPLLGTGWLWYGGGNLYYRGRVKTSTDLDPLKADDAYTRLNLQAGIKTPDERLDLQFWVNNATDKIVTTGNFDTVFQAGSFSAFKQPPRMWGVTATYHFGES